MFKSNQISRVDLKMYAILIQSLKLKDAAVKFVPPQKKQEMKVNYIRILEETFAKEQQQHFFQYYQLAQIKSKLTNQNAEQHIIERATQNQTHQQQPAPPEEQQIEIEGENEEEPEIAGPPQEPQVETIQNTFNSLTGLQVFKIYNDLNFFRELLQNKSEYPRQIDQLLWRITYLVGEVIMLVQSYLLDSNALKGCVIFTVKEINEAAFKVLDLELGKAKEEHRQELNAVKACMLEVFQEGTCNIQKARKIYNFVNKIWRMPLNFNLEVPVQVDPPQKIVLDKNVQTDQITFNLPDSTLNQSMINLGKNTGNSSMLNGKMEVSQVSPYYPELLQTPKIIENEDEPVNFKNYNRYSSSNQPPKPPVMHQRKQKAPQVNGNVIIQSKPQTWSPYANSNNNIASNPQPISSSFTNAPMRSVNPVNRIQQPKPFSPLNQKQKKEDSFYNNIKQPSQVYDLDQSIIDEAANQNFFEREPQSSASQNPYYAGSSNQNRGGFKGVDKIKPMKAQPARQNLKYHPIGTNLDVEMPKPSQRKPRPRPIGTAIPGAFPLTSSPIMAQNRQPYSNFASTGDAILKGKPQGSAFYNGSTLNLKPGNRNITPNNTQNFMTQSSSTYAIDLNEQKYQINLKKQLVSPPASIEPIVLPVIGPLVDSNNESQQVNTSFQKQDFKKRMRERWTPEQQSVLVAVFIEKGDEFECSQALGERFGQHPKWSVAGVKLRLDWIVRKVYQKFKSLNTKNESINRFKQNWDFISKSSGVSARKRIYQDIVTIYTAMLNMSEQKRQIISKKIMEINLTCQRENKGQTN